MDTRSAIISAASELLAKSPNGDISTRAVCEAAGVQQPVIYRLFGDKDGLLAATVDSVWDEYLGMKRAAEHSADAVEDLRSGWDSHVAFAIAHPHAYRLLFGSGALDKAESADEAMRLLSLVLERVAAQGRLRLDPTAAARIVMAANTGVALALILRPALYPDLALSTTMRDIIHGAIVLDSAAGPGAGEASCIAAITLREAIPALPATLFTDREAALLDEWLGRIHAQPPSR